MSFMRRNTRKATASEAESSSGAPQQDRKAKIFVKERRDHTIELGYEIPDEFVGQFVVVAVGLTHERRLLQDAEEAYRAKTAIVFSIDPKKMQEKGRSQIDAMRARDKVRNQVQEMYRTKFGLMEDDKVASSLSGLLAYNGHDEDTDSAKFANLWTMNQPTYSGEARGSITLTQMPQDADLDILFYFNVRKVDDRWNLAPLYELRLQMKTNKASWAVALESQGLSSLIDRFEANRLTTFERWAGVIDDAAERERLQIDDLAADTISALIARNGFITSAERERLAEERQDLALALDKLATSVARDDARFYVGQLVHSGSTKTPALEVVVHVTADTIGVRKFGQDADESRAARPAELRPANWKLFLSHSQRDAQNQVQNLHILLRAAGVPSWFDMDAEKLEAVDMIRGVRDADFFCLYLTEAYFERYFCRLEASYAMECKKPLLIVYEPDFRHGGSGSYTDLVDRATHKYPEFHDWLMASEAIPMARRAFQRHAMVTEIVKRVGGAPPRAAATPRGTQRGVNNSSVGQADTVEELKEEVLKLWDVVEALQDELARMRLENNRP